MMNNQKSSFLFDFFYKKGYITLYPIEGCLGWFQKGIKFKPFGGSSNGRTSGFGPANRGSSPCPPANLS